MRLLKESSLSDKKKIAIVGMACRFPGEASSPEAYWDVLKEGKDLVTEVSSERWGTDFYQHPDKKEPGKSYTFSAGVLPQVDEFDASFFGISPREAAQMDPQQRLLLELTWEALENGQQLPESLAGSDCAVYIGIASTDYAHRRMDDLSSLDPYSMTGNTASIASNRISYIYDLQGPSVSVDTACSSSLVALHQACNAIWNGDAPFAITGGVNMLLHPFGFVGFSKASMLSPRGRCRAFDNTGDGYVRSEGSAVLFLKPLEDAERDGDPIHAVIVNTGINCDGRTNGISLPSTEGQAALLSKVYDGAGVDPDSLCYVEAHGTGTAIGDPLEAAALTKALSKKRNKALPIGSAKTNLGHLETASGMAGLLKVILSLKNKAIPASLHFNEPNANIDFKGDKLSVVTSFTPLESSEKPLLMGVNSFGFGGANAHVIVEEYKPETKTKQSNSTQNKQTASSYPPLFLSANNTQALRDMAGQYRDLLQQDGVNYTDVAWSAYANRQQFDTGLAVHADEHHSIIECLHAFSQGEVHTGVTTGNKIEGLDKKSPKLALVFSGNGSQWQGMGCELLASEPLFLETVLEIDGLLKNHSTKDDEISLIEEFKADEDKSRLALTEVAQPLLFALQVGVMRVLESKGLMADAVTGHSVGEVAAAWAAGILTLEDAVRVIYQRSHAQGKTAGAGRMAAASMSEDNVRALLEDFDLLAEVSIAGINSPNAVTLSGPLSALEKLNHYFDDEGIFFRLLDLDYAFHSPAMDPVENDIKDSLA
jgi:acyl transferase domain-containing protein